MEVWIMHAWESIQKVLDYIEDNLTQSHSPDELSKVAALSSFYFQRLFTRLVKRPVNEYIKMRRLANACDILEDKNKRILDISLECGFNSHEHFTKTFKSAFGITPEEYRNNPVRLNQIMKPDLLLGYTMIDENVPLITDSIVLEISRKTITAPELYIGLSAPVSVSEQTPLGEATGIDIPGMLWDKFHEQKAGIKGLAPEGIEFAASSFGDNDDGTFTYFVGASATFDAAAYDDFEIYKLPAAEYIVCSFEAENFEELITSALGKSMNYLFGTWLPNHNLSTQPFSAEKYINVKPEICKMELWVMPVSLD
jgi:AraC family transcriptional regulator